MASASLRANGEVTNEWFLSGIPTPNTHAGALADEALDTSITSSTDGETDRQTYDDAPSDLIQSQAITVRLRDNRSGGAGDIRIRLFAGGVQIGADKYATYPGISTDDDFTDAAWDNLTKTQVDSIEVEFYSSNIPSKKNVEVIRSEVFFDYDTYGYQVFIAEGGETDLDLTTPDYTTPTGTLTATIPVSLKANTVYTIGVRALSLYGLASSLDVITVVTDGSGIVAFVPNAPHSLTATELVGGDVRIEWRYDPVGGAVPSEFRVYSNGGSGDVDYTASIQTVASNLTDVGGGVLNRPPKRYRADLTGLTEGAAYRFAVRARTSGGKEEENRNTVSAVPDATGPSIFEDTITVTEDNA